MGMNEVHLQGRIINTWSYAGDVLVRVSVDRDMGRPAKGAGRERYDYLTVRFLGGRDTGLTLERGQTLEVHGFLQSRDYDETLASWLNGAVAQGKARKPEMPDGQGRAIITRRVTTEVIAERWAVTSGNGSGSRPQHKRRRPPKKEPTRVIVERVP